MSDIGGDTYNKKIAILCFICIVISTIPILTISYYFTSEEISFEQNLEWTVSAFLIGGDKSNIDSLALLIILYILGVIFISLIITIVITMVEKHLHLEVLRSGIKKIAKDVLDEEQRGR